ncbi:hypothetical protein ACJ73_06589 [Blastomyces percursus]|uniref:Rhodopsin domain-containing protein n=1 Tax=Blastomyces percursus TaxID=1658174 RepID=A0A1J9R384_9EURO|nr:hypothetical protein ACJ73_06589 [Blastomyces percursus]
MPGGFHPPPSVIKSWPKPNYVDPEAKGHDLVAISITLGLLATIAVGARLWVRLKIQRNPGLDDLFLFLSIIPMLGNTALFVLIGAKHRWHRHIWDVTPDSLVGRQYVSCLINTDRLCMRILLTDINIKALMGSPNAVIPGPFLLCTPICLSLNEYSYPNFSPSFVFATCFAKVSTLLLYKRVVQSTSRRLYMVIVNIALGILAIYGIAFVILMALQCQPTEAYWMQFSYPVPYTKDFKCMFEGTTPMANAIMSVITDFIAAMLPMLLFTQLRLPRMDKIALSILFGVGFLYVQIDWDQLDSLPNTPPPHHSQGGSHDLWVWLTVETDLLIFCSAIPPLKCLFNNIIRPLRGSKNSASLRLAKLARITTSTYSYSQSGSKGTYSDEPAFGHESGGPQGSKSKLVTSPVYAEPEAPAIVVTKTHSTWVGKGDDQV